MHSDHYILIATVFSKVLGWSYFLCWSLSCYPQPLLNWRRRSTVGATIDFPTIGLLGCIFYFLSNALLAWSPVIRRQYADRNPSAPLPTVQNNDIAFAAHAAVLNTVVISMFWKRLWGFDQKQNNGFQTPTLYACGMCIVGVAWVASIVVTNGSNDGFGWSWIDVVSTMGYAKLFITTIKYMPQAWENYNAKSTKGWSIWAIFLDMAGGILSISQLVIDAYIQGNWSAIISNPVKLGLGSVSISFDLLFLVQHYWLYPHKEPSEKDGEGERAALLSARERGYHAV